MISDAQRPSASRLLPIIPLALWLALVAGLLEALAVVLQRPLFHRFIHTGPDVLWMAPVMNVVIYGALALVLTRAGRRWPILCSTRVVVFVFSAVAYSSLLLLITVMSKWAVFLLALGLAAQTSRMAAAHPSRLWRFVASSLGWSARFRRPPAAGADATPQAGSFEETALTRRDFVLGAAVPVTALAAGVRAWRVGSERAALAALPRARPSMPNVLVIVLDTVRASSLTVYGRTRQTTPNLVRLAQEGVLFERAYSTSPWTLPSHASLFTGRYPHELTANWTRALDRAHPTVAESARAIGYRTAGFVANVVYCQSETGLSRGFVHFSDYELSAGEFVTNSSLARFVVNSHHLRRVIRYKGVLAAKRAEDINGDFLQWLGGGDRRPFFAFLNYFDAHEPYDPPPPFDDLFGTALLRRVWDTRYWGRQGVRLGKTALSPGEVQAELDAYESTIAYSDAEIGKLAQELRSRGMWDDTLVVITADHGEQFGEHGLFGHGNSLYRPVLHVPLIVLLPHRSVAGTRIGDPVTLRDVAATLADVIPLGDQVRFPGRSLAAHWSGLGSGAPQPGSPILAELEPSAELPAYTPGSRGSMRSVLLGESHYILNGDRKEELFDWRSDPAEERNLASDEQLLEPFRRALRAALAGETAANVARCKAAGAHSI